MFAPSLMCADLLDLRHQVEILNSRADLYHVDIMDGHYVKNITLSPMFIEQISRISDIPIDAHLMVEHPDDFLETLARAGAGYISPHAECMNRDAFRMIQKIKALGCKAGAVLNPATTIESIRHYLPLLDKITILTVDAGFAGQKFIPQMLDKIEAARNLKQQHGYSYLVEVDGSCNSSTYHSLKNAGAEVFIVGSSGLFGLSSDLAVAWDMMTEQFLIA